MKQKQLDQLTVDQLVDLFADIGVSQDEALLQLNTSKYNRLFEEMALVVAELRQRRGDQRHALRRLYGSDNIQVRFMAATKTLALYPDESRTLLLAIHDVKWIPQCAHAGSILRGLDDGTFNPT